MIGELAVVGIAGTIITIVDQQNLISAISNNPSKKFWWDMSRWTPAPTVRFPQQIQQPRLSPQQELSQARMGVVGAEQVLKAVSEKYPALAVTSKYALTVQPQYTIEPIHPNQGYGQ
jgi:hypothetical protein